MLTIAFIPLAVGTYFLADYAIWAIAGKSFVSTEAPNVLRILMLGAVLYPLDRFNGITLDILQQTKVNFHKVIIMGAASILSAFIGTMAFHNIYGVVLSTPFTTLTGIVFGGYYLRKHINYSIKGVLTTGFTETRNFIRVRLLGKPLNQTPAQD